MRLAKANGSSWMFPALTKSGHIEPSSLKKQHVKAIAEATRILREETRKDDAELVPFELYTLRHTCLTGGRRTWTRGRSPTSPAIAT